MSETKTGLAELEGKLSNVADVQAMLKEGTFTDFVKDYVAAKTDANADIQAQVREEVQAGLAEFLKDNGGATRPAVGALENRSINAVARGKGEVYNAAAPGAKADRVYDSMSEFLQSVWHNVDTMTNAADLKDKAAKVRKVQNSYGSVVPADGGFLIPEELRSDLLQLSLENSVVRPRAQVIPMSSLAVPIPVVDDTSHASSVFGGITAYWTEEGAAAQESQAKFGRTRLEAKKLTVYSEAPNELVADAPAFNAFLSQAMPRAVAFYEDDAFINGTGAGEPLGVLNSAAAVSPTRETSGAVSFTDIVNMYARMLPQSLNSAVWIVSPAVIPELLKLVNDTGSETVSPSLWLTGGQAISGPTMSLLGRPLIVSEKVPNLGTTGDVAFIDFGFYLIGDRQMMQASSSPHFKFQTDETAYKVVERVDGRPWINSALTPKNGGDTLSPIVTLSSEQTGS